MRLLKLYLLCFATGCMFKNVVAQTQLPTNANINIVTDNAGIVSQGSIINLSVSITNTGANPIQKNRVRPSISIPIGIATAVLDNAQQIPGLPTGWVIVANTSGATIIICNGTDVIPAGETRTAVLKIQGTALGGPLTIGATLQFGPGTGVCTGLGTLNGDAPADNISSTTITVVPACPLTVSATAGTIVCNGGTTSLTATTTGAVGAVEYSITGGAPFQASNVFTVPAGTYTVLARQTNNNNCTAVSSAILVLQPAALAVPLVGTIVQPSCTIATGSVQLSGLPSGSWVINPGNISGSGSTTTISNLANGSYNFIVTNVIGCSSLATANVVINAQPLTPSILVVGTITQPTCSTAGGSVVLSGLPAGNWIINPGNIAGTGVTTTVANLTAGMYNFTVTNGDGCISTATANVLINAFNGVPAAPIVNIVQPSCTVSTGLVTITSTTTGLLFSLDANTFAPYPATGYNVNSGTHTLSAQNSAGCISIVLSFTVNTQPPVLLAPAINIVQPTCTVVTGLVTITSNTTGQIFSIDGAPHQLYPIVGYNLLAGAHTLIAQNNDGCLSSPINFTINTQPISPTGSITAGTISCNAGTTTLTVNALGAVTPYEYSLDGVVFQPSDLFTVGAATYTVTIKSANTCTTTTNTIAIAQPTAITVAVAGGTIACNGQSAALTVTVAGGILPLQYSLNNNPIFQTSNIFSVTAGAQTITVKDANGCTKTANVVTISQPAILKITATAPRITNCGGKTLVTVAATGGTLPYTNIGTFTKDAGLFAFSVTDANGCAATTQIDIEATGCMDLQGYPNPAKESITINHTIAEAGATMQLYTTVGQKILTIPVPIGAFKTTVDLRKYSSGSYMLVYQNGKDRKKFLFKK